MGDDRAEAGAGAARGEHPSLDDLLSYADGNMDNMDMEGLDISISSLRTHLASCGECAGVVARYQLVAETVRADAMAMPAPEVLARAKALFPRVPSTLPSSRPDLLQPVRRVLAELIFDSFGGLTPGLAGYRGSGDRHMTFVAESVQIDLHLQAPLTRDGIWLIHGQVDAVASNDSLVDMVHAGDERAVTQVRTDDQGMFALEAPAGRYDLLVRLPDVIHVLPGLSIG